MTTYDDRRFEMHETLRQLMGDDVAGTIMEHLPPSGWGDVARSHDLVSMEGSLTGQFANIHLKFETIDRRFDEADRRFTSIDQRLDRLETRLTAGFATGVVFGLAMIALQIQTILSVA